MQLVRVTTVTDELLAALARLMPQLTDAPISARADLESMLANSVLLIAREADEHSPIVGMATLATFRSPAGLHGHIEDVVVDEAARGQKIGEALINDLLSAAAELGLKRVSLTCRPARVAANKMYQKLGFKKWETNLYWREV